MTTFQRAVSELFSALHNRSSKQPVGARHSNIRFLVDVSFSSAKPTIC